MNRYEDIPIIRGDELNNKKQHYSTVSYPEIPLSPSDTYIITTVGDRLDILAQQIYKDKGLWWILSIANVGLAQNSLYIPVGTQLRVPVNVQNIVSSY